METSGGKICVLIVDDHPLMREALAGAIEDEEDLLLVGEATNGASAVEQAAALHPDVIVMDLYMPVMDGTQAIIQILERDPRAHILALTSSADEENVVSAVKAGALGYLLKDSERSVILAAIREVHQGRTYLPPNIASKLFAGLRTRSAPSDEALAEALTPREKDVLALVGKGASNLQIARALCISEGTVRTHMHNILQKLDLENRNQAILYALKGEKGK